ncbi:response regulator [Microbacterium lacticum]|uniref:LuxR family two component transcriptional regulator n=1 Tax=Microbacterium lacticum TaxID=33885 RepID=A0A4Y3UNC2_9MICO|nr:response regulator transcription factor [Microbacterium lacticum]TQN00465.1 LuxR family two component transcriptional regulator [Microbacterium lacticum]GEB94415.1 DNA-binding response regulator [Microbacterium lacticum]GGN17731.1 DNA-binding response regulator [Microbacterium lacticum]
MTEAIRVIIVDDESLVRAALRVFLESADGFELVGEADNGADAITLVRATQPDVVLMDVQMPIMDGIEATQRLTREFPGLKIVALTTFCTERVIVPMLSAGASGFLVKDTSPDRILDAARLAHEGGYVLSPRVAKELVTSVQSGAASATRELGRDEELTERELEVVTLLAQGMSNAEIAAAMYVSEATVKSHLGRITAKWGVRDRIQVLIRATQLGLVTLV